MVEKWSKIIGELGWIKQDFEFPLFTKLVNGLLYVEAMPDTSNGLVPTVVNVSLKRQEEIHDYLMGFSRNIHIGDLSGNWNHPNYSPMKIYYQVIPVGKSKINKEARSQVRQAERNGVTIRPIKTIDNYFQCIVNTCQRQNRPPTHPWTIEQILKHGEGLEAVYNGQVIAGCLLVQEDGIIRYCNSASLDDFMHLRPNSAILNAVIEVAKQRGISEIWLGNAPLELQGLMKFKESFGAELRTFEIMSFTG